MLPQPRILFVFGTRPECIKLAPLILEAKKKLPHVTTCFTGQHKEMALPVLDFFKIHLDYNLEIMKPSQTLNDISVALFSKLGSVLDTVKPTHLVVQGDTTTAAAAALMAFQSQIDVIHVEAGLRTHDLKSPWPEEFNRRMIALATKWHFAPTELSKNNLIKEGFSEQHVFQVGNTGIDALRLVTEKQSENLNRYKHESDFLVLVTLHRRENFGSEMIALMQGLKQICQTNSHVKVLWPMHQNPQVKKAFAEVFTEIPKNLILEKPLDYFHFVNAMAEADLIVTDSGGVQEEAPFLGKPILICRTTTERPESVDCGAARLIGTSKEKLIESVLELSQKNAEYKKMAVKRNPFGDGFASEKIINVLLKNLIS